MKPRVHMLACLRVAALPFFSLAAAAWGAEDLVVNLEAPKFFYVGRVIPTAPVTRK